MPDAVTTEPPANDELATAPILPHEKVSVLSKHSVSCSHCGMPTYADPFPEDAQRRISELESQVRLLTDKATDAVDKLADYEDELRKLKAARAQNIPQIVKEEEPLPPIPSAGESSTLFTRPALQHRPSTGGRFNFLSTRKGAQQLTPQPSPLSQNASPEEQTSGLSNALKEEKSARQEAEKKVSQMNTEIEELSSTLFQQANEMVSTERQARAKLEDRAEMFEKRCAMLEERVRILEKRDSDKKRRLDSLEEAVRRCERVRKLLQGGIS